jgi:hypothetical protein
LSAPGLQWRVILITEHGTPRRSKKERMATRLVCTPPYGGG